MKIGQLYNDLKARKFEFDTRTKDITYEENSNRLMFKFSESRDENKNKRKIEETLFDENNIPEITTITIYNQTKKQYEIEEYDENKDLYKEYVVITEYSEEHEKIKEIFLSDENNDQQIDVSKTIIHASTGNQTIFEYDWNSDSYVDEQRTAYFDEQNKKFLEECLDDFDYNGTWDMKTIIEYLYNEYGETTKITTNCYDEDNELIFTKEEIPKRLKFG